MEKRYLLFRLFINYRPLFILILTGLWFRLRVDRPFVRTVHSIPMEYLFDDDVILFRCVIDDSVHSDSSMIQFFHWLKAIDDIHWRYSIPFVPFVTDDDCRLFIDSFILLLLFHSIHLFDDTLFHFIRWFHSIISCGMIHCLMIRSIRYIRLTYSMISSIPIDVDSIYSYDSDDSFHSSDIPLSLLWNDIDYSIHLILDIMIRRTFLFYSDDDYSSIYSRYLFPMMIHSINIRLLTFHSIVHSIHSWLYSIDDIRFTIGIPFSLMFIRWWLIVAFIVIHYIRWHLFLTVTYIVISILIPTLTDSLFILHSTYIYHSPYYWYVSIPLIPFYSMLSILWKGEDDILFDYSMMKPLFIDGILLFSTVLLIMTLLTTINSDLDDVPTFIWRYSVVGPSSLSMTVDDRLTLRLLTIQFSWNIQYY